MTQDEADVIRRRASSVMHDAIRKGLLPKITKKTKCVDCGDKAYGYDHRDYYKPLDVQPVCRKCNARRGAAHPVADDRYEYNGTKWGGLNDGEGQDWICAHPIHAKIDWPQIEFDLEVARRKADPDVAIADREIWRIGGQKKKKLWTKGVWVSGTLFNVTYGRKFDNKEKRVFRDIMEIQKDRLMLRRTA